MTALLIALLVSALSGSPELCSLAEVMAYEAQGYDAFECDADKAMEAEERPAVTP